MLSHLHPSPRVPDRVVVIGAGGFVGSAIVQQLAQEGVPVEPLTRAEMNLLSSGAAESLATMLRPTDSVVLVSAIAPAKTVAMLMDNLRMAETVCSALASTEIAHLVYVSSDAVYADDANPVTEESPCAPSTLHGVMHLTRELMLKSSTRAPVAILRPTLIYGARDPHNGYGPNRFRREAARGRDISIFGEGEEQRDHVLVQDVARVTTLVLAHRSAGAINVVTGVSTSFSGIAHRIAEQFSVKVISQPRPGLRPHLLHRFFDVTQCLEAFPSFHYTPLTVGLEQAREGDR
jgi:nucleoside-diphosphate-sugar epimerase